MGIRCHTGVYVAVAGPNLETRAEYRFLRTIGADVVGMSVVPEVLVAVHSGMRVLGLAIVTDLCLPDALKPADIGEIIKVANAAERKMTAIVEQVIAQTYRRANMGKGERGADRLATEIPGPRKNRARAGSRPASAVATGCDYQPGAETAFGHGDRGHGSL